MSFVPQAYIRQGHKVGEPNKLESNYLAYLHLLHNAGEVISYEFEQRRFDLPGRITFRPDTVEQRTGSERPWCVDIKPTNSKTGKPLMTAISRMKLKQCVELYPEFRWFVAYVVCGAWNYLEFLAPKGKCRQASKDAKEAPNCG